MPHDIKIRLADNSDARIWNDYVQNHPNSGPYHLWEWRKSITEAYKHAPVYLIAEENEFSKNLGLLALFYIKPPLTKGQLVSLPFCDYGGPLSDNNDVETALCQEACNKAASLGAKLELRCNQPLTHAHSFAPFGDKVRLILDLPENSKVLFKQFRPKLRSQIRRPIKEGLFFKVGGRELVHDFYHVFSINMRDLGSPVHSLSLFESLSSHYGERARVGVVYKEDTPVAGGVILLHRDTLSIPWASSLRSYNRLSPNMLLYWSFLEYAADNGYQKFDFGRSSPGSGTFRFKKQWGAEPQEVFWYSQEDGPNKASNKGKIRQRAENIWMKLPVDIANYLGPKVRRYISL